VKPICDEARKRAIEVMRKHMTRLGMTASAECYEPALYTRDVMITSWGALLAGETTFHDAVRQSLETLKHYQSEVGQVPAVVWMREPEPVAEYGDEDSNLWYIVTHWYLWRVLKDTAWLGEHIEALEKALFWLRCQDHDEDGLIETREGGNWADIFVQRYNVLSDNALWAMAQLGMSEMLQAVGRDGSRLAEMARDTREKIQLMFWVDAESPAPEDAFSPPAVPDIYRKKWRYRHVLGALRGKGYYLPFLTFLDFADYFDSLGNFLAILAGVPGERVSHGERITDHILHFVDAVGVNRPYPVRCIYPPIFPGDKWWREQLRQGEAHREKANMPWQYHNGAIWPWIGGFYVAALVRAGQLEKAEEELEMLARAGQVSYSGSWRFNEWLHGETGKPMGGDDQNWNAGLYIYAYDMADTIFCSTSTSVFGMRPLERGDLELLRDSGIRHIELTMRAAFTGPGDRRQIDMLAQVVADGLLTVHSGHAGWSTQLDISSPNDMARETAIAHATDCIETLARLNARLLVLHPSWHPIEPGTETERIRLARQTVLQLTPVARKCGLRLAPEVLAPPCVPCNAEQMLQLLDGVDPEWVGCCYDVNHGNLRAEPASDIRALDRRIIHFHVSDNDGIKERHWMPFAGCVDWRGIMAAIRDIRYTGALNFEVGMAPFTDGTTIEHTLAERREVFARLLAMV